MNNYWNLIMRTMFCKNADLEDFDSAYLLKEVYEIFKSNKLLNHYCTYLNNHNISSSFIQKGINEESINKRMKIKLVNEMKHLITLFNNEKIEPIITKGVVLSWLEYNNEIFRFYRDIDIVLPFFDEQINDCLKIMEALDYKQNFGWDIVKNIDVSNIIFSESIKHHEITCTKGISGYLKFELKKSLSCIPINIIKQFNEHTTILKLSMDELTTYDIYHTFLILCSNVFQNSETRSTVYYNNSFARDYIDIILFLHNNIKYIDVKRLSDYIFTYNLQNRANRVFINILELLLLCESKIYKHVINFIESTLTNINHEININKTIEEDIFDEVSFSKYEIINWSMPIYERMFNRDRETLMKIYKKHIYNIELPRYDGNDTVFSYNKKIYNEISFINANDLWYLKVDFASLIENKLYLKFEVLSSPENDEFLLMAFITPTDYEAVGRVNVFDSNAKYIERLTENNIQYEADNNTVSFNITDIVSDPLRKYKKFVYRVSLVRIFEDVIHQEIGAHSKQYIL